MFQFKLSFDLAHLPKMGIKSSLATLITVILLFCTAHFTNAYSSDAVKLSDVKVLTLYNGKMTNGRRSSPVPQLKCVGGSAGCYAFIPQVVQCYNRGSDGTDIQWECKTDMDNAYRFGQVSVSCEGYSYPDDPYILKGSCGLEYTIDLTKEGYEKQQKKGHNYYGDQARPKDHRETTYDGSSVIGNILFFVIVGFMIYALYKTCIRPMAQGANQFSTTNDDFGGYPGGDQAPPPPGFRPDIFSNAHPRNFPGSSAGCGAQSSSMGSGGPAGGFWTGAATGGILGYMFGRRNNPSGADTTNDYRSRARTYERRSYDSPTASTSGGGAWSSESTGTRTASGFGGTTRR